MEGDSPITVAPVALVVHTTRTSMPILFRSDRKALESEVPRSKSKGAGLPLPLGSAVTISGVLGAFPVREGPGAVVDWLSAGFYIAAGSCARTVLSVAVLEASGTVCMAGGWLAVASCWFCAAARSSSICAFTTSWLALQSVILRHKVVLLAQSIW